MQPFSLARYASQLEVSRLAGCCSLSVGDRPQIGDESHCLSKSEVFHPPFESVVEALTLPKHFLA
jgi:hypothetical protein